jgi:Fe2+ transport system protein B
MQIFTIDMILEMLKQAKETFSMLFESILSAAWSSIAESLTEIAPSLISHDWSGIFVLTTIILFIYRLIRRNLLSTLGYLLDR